MIKKKYIKTAVFSVALALLVSIPIITVSGDNLSTTKWTPLTQFELHKIQAGGLGDCFKNTCDASTCPSSSVISASECVPFNVVDGTCASSHTKSNPKRTCSLNGALNECKFHAYSERPKCAAGAGSAACGKKQESYCEVSDQISCKRTIKTTNVDCMYNCT